MVRTVNNYIRNLKVLFNYMENELKRWISYKDRYVECDLLFCTKHCTRFGVSNFERNFRIYCERVGLKKKMEL